MQTSLTRLTFGECTTHHIMILHILESDLATTGICHTVGAEHELRVASASASACHQGHSPIFARQKSPNKRQTNDEIDEIQPEAAGGVYPAKCRPNMHTEASEEILEMEIVAEDVQEIEDAALALRLAQEQDWVCVRVCNNLMQACMLPVCDVYAFSPSPLSPPLPPLSLSYSLSLFFVP